MPTTTKRIYRSNDLWSTVTTDAGSLAVHPITADRRMFDAAKANHIPAYGHEGMHGSTVLDIGHGVLARVSGAAERVGACWEISWLEAMYTKDGGSISANGRARAEALVFEMLQAWAATHEGDIAQADQRSRNNAAINLEGKIAEHEDALRILRDNLIACDEGEPFSEYPDLPTGHR